VRRVSFETSAFEDFQAWETIDRPIYIRIVTLLKDILRSPFTGLGKPEPLKHELKGFWSRRITQEHRLVYRVTETEIIVVACKYHYNQ
jgi:toxin YoeB